MDKKVIIGVVVLVLLVGGVFAWQVLQTDPAEIAESFLEKITAQDFSSMEDYFDEKSHPSEAELKDAYGQFGEAFSLSKVTITDFAPLSQDSKKAIFSFELNYESRYFEPLKVASSLIVKREGWFDDWKVEWQNNLPLPSYGLQASYSKMRLDPRRGNIVDSKGKVLAGEGSLVAVGVQPDRISDADVLLQALEEQLGLKPEYVRGKYEASGVQGHWFVALANLAEAEYLRVDPVLRPIPGIFFRRVDTRAYPEHFKAAHITGYLGEVTSSMITSFPERDYISGEIVGRAALESSRDSSLRGYPGYRFYVTPENGSRILVTEKPVVLGKNLELTLDSWMQELAYQVLGEHSGSFVVLDAESGAILVLASTPSYDPNEFSVGISSKRWQELSTDLQKPMFNRSLQGLYPPGSVFKVVTTAVALDQGLYEPTSQFVDTGELRVEGNIIRNFQRQIFGEHDLHTALVESINTTIAQVGLKLGAPLLEEYFERWGLNKSFELGLPMLSGQIGTPGRSKVALAWSAIGQDQVLLTPLHLAQIFSVFANEGNLATVHLLETKEEPNVTRVLKAETVEQMNGMLKDVVLQGTGQNAQGTGLELYAKTGTAEVVGKGVHALFGGHVQIQDGRKLAFALLVEEGGVGGQVAAPLVRDYFMRLVQ